MPNKIDEVHNVVVSDVRWHSWHVR